MGHDGWEELIVSYLDGVPLDLIDVFERSLILCNELYGTVFGRFNFANVAKCNWNSWLSYFPMVVEMLVPLIT